MIYEWSGGWHAREGLRTREERGQQLPLSCVVLDEKGKKIAKENTYLIVLYGALVCAHNGTAPLPLSYVCARNGGEGWPVYTQEGDEVLGGGVSKAMMRRPR
jgi:hypothetical protein